MNVNSNKSLLRHAVISVFALIGLYPLCLQARHLEPQEALNTVMSQSTNKAPGLQVNSLNLAYEEPMIDASQTAVYVFSQPEAGFVVIAADDALPQLLLGYSESSKFDATNMPPSFKWMMSQYAEYVRQVSEGKVYNNVPMIMHEGLYRVKAGAPSAISPLCQTSWDQVNPYNSDCPIVNKSRSVTGCMATAMAQIMKVHNWPDKGTGYKSYSYRNGTLTESFDFGNTTFGWENMLNNYNGSYNNNEKDAVAALMHGCGVAAETDYSSTTSSASEFNAAQGLITYLKYDKSLTYYAREWFTSNEWENMIYQQLHNGNPVLLSGTDGTVGHAFVCDGCDTSSYYHINWGWGGYCDGYYSLADLNPDGTGTGGGSGDAGYNFDQTILVNVVPDHGTTQYTGVCAIGDIFETEKNEYSRNNSTNVSFTPKNYDGTSGGFWNYSLGSMKCTFGVKLDIAGGPKYLELTTSDLEPWTGYSQLRVKSTDFPTGEYDVTAVYKTNGSDWEPMYFNRNLSDGKLHFTVTSNKITITDSRPEVGDITAATLASITQNGKEVENYYLGQSYDFNWKITTSGQWNGVLLCGLIQGNYIMAKSEMRTIEYANADTYSEAFKVDVSSSLGEGEYAVCLLQYKDGYYYSLQEYNISFIQNEEINSGSIKSVEFVGSATDGTSQYMPAILPDDNPVIKVTLCCDGNSWNEDVKLVFANVSDYIIFANTESQAVHLVGEGSSTVLTFTGPWSKLANNTTYLMAVWGNLSNQLSDLYYFQLQEISPEENPAAHVSSVTFAGTDASGTSLETEAKLALDNQKITVTMQCEVGPWSQDIFLEFRDIRTSIVEGTSESQTVTLAEANDIGTVVFTGPWNGLETNTTYNMVVCDDLGNELSNQYYMMIQDINSISNISVDCQETQYYNLQGLKVKGNLVPGIYIQVLDGKATRVLIK